jgi:hypothetical protein
MKTSQRLVADARAIVDRIKAEGRGPTAEERGEVEGLISEASILRLGEAMAFDPISGSTGGRSGSPSSHVLRRLEDAGVYDGDDRAAVAALATPVAIPSDAVLGPPRFGAAMIADPTTAAPVRLEGISAMGFDARHFFTQLPRQPLEGTAVQELVQNARALAAPGSTQVPFGGSTAKPTTTVGVVLATFEPTTVATVSEPIPNAIVRLDAFRRLLDETLSQALRDGLDDLVVTELTAAAGTISDDGDDLFEQLRKAVTNLQGLGFAPDLAGISPTDAETLDLSRSGGSTIDDGPFVLQPAPRASAFTPLWSLQVTPSKTITDPIVLDRRVVTLYATNAVFALNSFSSGSTDLFGTNRSVARLELDAVVVVHQGDGVQLVSTGS